MTDEYVIITTRPDGERFQVTMYTWTRDEAERIASYERSQLRNQGLIPGYTVTVEPYSDTEDEADLTEDELDQIPHA